jgi:hypothetical protein
MMKKWVMLLFGGVAGSGLGFVYWYYVGCVSGTCPITSSPVNSTLYGFVLGVLTVNLFLAPKNETRT